MKSWWVSPLGPVNTSNIERDLEIIVDVKSALDLEPDKQPECCIYRVPQKLSKVNEDCEFLDPLKHNQINLVN